MIVLSYIKLYAPFGINDTDGGFITAYAWRLLHGELLYEDIIYVRPPMSILIRYVELLLLPEQWEVFGERALFYLKIAGYSWLGAAILFKGNRRWLLATLAFIVSVHSYPAAAWHTVDGILLSVAALYALFRGQNSLLVALLVLLAMLCKQSFYPLLPLFLLLSFLLQGVKGLGKNAAAFLLWAAGFALILQQLGILHAYLSWTSGSTSITQAIDHGIYDYFRIDGWVLPLLLLLIPLCWKNRYRKYAWYLFIAGLIASFAWSVYSRQAFSIPITQSRLLFDLALVYLIIQFFRQSLWRLSLAAWGSRGRLFLAQLALMAVSWMAAISWGYSFPILFALPYIGVLYALTRTLEFGTSSMGRSGLRLALIFALIFVFRYSHEFVYRDGRRSEMTYAMQTIFPKLQWIYSDQGTFEKYTELKQLHAKYGDQFKTLPSFPHSNYLTNTQSPFPIDWVVNEETNHRNEDLYRILETTEAYFFVEKEYDERLKRYDKYEISRYVLEHFTILEETRYFYVCQKP